ncbi:MAG TPA: protein kinase [Planctomycetota bacterium]|nr:protein kinase [Planctomycetota bacterium]
MNVDRVREVMEGALARDTDEIPGFLDETCGPDADLRREVESLLDARKRMGRYLEVPAAAALVHDTELSPGDRIGGYEILGVIGRGGSGVVYEARQKNPDRVVALKTVRLRRPGAETPFLAEAQTLARLRHPGIATVHEAGVHAGMPWFAMERVEGARDLVRHARDLEMTERVRLVADVADAVHHGHQRGVVHRDLKPANILVDASGLPKIIDFGIARAHGERGEITGTPPYMSPEQCGGGAAVDVRSDVYALGVILFEVLSGRLPHAVEGLPLTEAMRVVRERPPDPLVIPSRRDLASIAAKAMRKDPDERYASAAELAADLRRHLAHEPVLAHPSSILYRTRKFVRRHRALTLSFALVVVTSVTAAIVSLREAAATERALARAEQRGYVAAIAAADGALRGGDVGTAKGALLGAPARLRGWEWNLLASMADMSRGGGRGPGGGGIGVLFLPGEDRVLGASGYPYLAGGFVCIWDAASGRELFRTEPLKGFPPMPAVSSDGRRVAWHNWREITLADEKLAVVARFGTDPFDLVFHPTEPLLLATAGKAVLGFAVPEGTPRFRLGTGDSRATRLALDGPVLAAGAEDGTVRVWDFPTRELRWALPCGAPVEALALGYGRVAASGQDGTVRCWSLADGGELFSVRHGDERSKALAFGPGGTTLFCGHDDAAIDIRDARTGKRTSSLFGHCGPIYRLVFSADGRTLLSSGDTTWKLWDLPPTPHEVALGTHRELVRDLVFRPDGAAIACASFDGSVKVYDVGTREPLADVHLIDTTTGCVRYSPDGSRIYAGVADGSIRVLDGRSYEPVGSWKAHGGSVFSLAPHPGGRWLASTSQDTTMAVWDLSTGREVFREAGSVWIWSAVFSPDGSLLASSGTDGTPRVERVRLRETGSWRIVRDLVHPADVITIAFSPDGSLLATGARDGGVRLWDVRTGQCRCTMSCVPAYVERVAFSPDGTRVAVATGRTVQIWDPATGARLLTLRAGIVDLLGVSFSPDGTVLAAGGGRADGTGCGISLWGRTGGAPWPPVLRED